MRVVNGHGFLTAESKRCFLFLVTGMGLGGQGGAVLPRCHEMGQTGLGLPPCQGGPVMASVQTASTSNLKEKALCHLLPLGLFPESPVETPPVCPR